MEDNVYNLINKYIIYYNKTHPNKTTNMFDNIDYDDPTSTNHILEMFYDTLALHNKIDNDVYEFVENIDDFDDLYMLETKDKKYFSQSVISLLYILEDYTNDWNIINLK